MQYPKAKAFKKMAKEVFLGEDGGLAVWGKKLKKKEKGTYQVKLP